MKTAGKNSLSLFLDNNENQKSHTNNLIEKYNKEHNLSFEGSNVSPFPVDGDMVMFPFRHISATVVGSGGYKSTDFGDSKVLKAGMDMLQEKPAYLNHNLQTGKEIGTIGETKWSNGYTNSEGEKVPSGIDAPFVIDKVLYPDLVRKMSSKPSPIQSASVTVLFEWEASHEFEHDSDFFWHLGEEIDGTEVTRIVKNIVEFYESSLVWLGADPYAKMLDVNGQVINIDKGSLSINNFSKDEILEKYSNNKKYFIYGCKNEKSSVSLNNSFDKKKEKMKELIAQLAAQFSVKESEITVEMIKEHSFTKTTEFSAMEEKAAKTDNLEKEVGTLKAEKTGFENEITTLKADKNKLEVEIEENKGHVEFSKGQEGSLRKETKALYEKFAGTKIDEKVVSEIESDSIDNLQTKIKMFGGKLYDNFGAHCKDCDSVNIELKSSISKDDDEPKDSGSFNLAEQMRMQ